MYSIIILPEPQKKFNKFNAILKKRIAKSLQNLSLNPFPQGYKKLKNRIGYRIRVGNYGIIYEVLKDEIVIEIIDIDHRKDIYKTT